MILSGLNMKKFCKFVHTRSHFFLTKINIKVVNITFTIGVITVLASHILFSVGLYDGSMNLLDMIKKNRFFSEQSRNFFHTLYLLPAYLFIKISSSESLSLIIYVFSFGLIWIHILSLLGCYLILPKNKKHLIFFPLFTGTAKVY